MARVRIRDIAEQAGVSPATVSRYLNNKPGQMTEQTRERIAAVIERTGYRPRAAARSLRLDNTHLLGVILADGGNPYTSAMLEELSGRAAARGYSLMTSLSSNDAAREQMALSRLVEAGVEGLIVNTCGACDDAIERTARRVPVVLLDRDTSSGELDLVTSNNAVLMRELMNEVAKAGCTHVALVTECGGESSIRRARIEAFERVAHSLQKQGTVIELPQDVGAAAQTLKRCLGSSAGCPAGGVSACTGAAEKGGTAPVWGVIAINGLVFLRLAEALGAQGVTGGSGFFQGPLVLATFDDYPWNHVIYGGVTTAAQDTAAIASAVLENMIERIEGSAAQPLDRAKMAARRIEVPGKIIPRASTMRFYGVSCA